MNVRVKVKGQNMLCFLSFFFSHSIYISLKCLFFFSPGPSPSLPSGPTSPPLGIWNSFTVSLSLSCSMSFMFLCLSASFPSCYSSLPYLLALLSFSFSLSLSFPLFSCFLYLIVVSFSFFFFFSFFFTVPGHLPPLPSGFLVLPLPSPPDPWSSPSLILRIPCPRPPLPSGSLILPLP